MKMSFLPVESECEGEAERELGLLGEDQDTSNLSGENEDDAGSDSARQGIYLTLACNFFLC